MQTSRARLIDAVELIANDIAQASHIQEKINNIEQDLELWEWDEKGLLVKKQDLILLLSDVVKRRRDTMTTIKEAFPEWDGDFWCSLKHAIASYWYATELYYANENFYPIQRSSYETMIEVISSFIWVEITSCWRCLHDQLLSNK